MSDLFLERNAVISDCRKYRYLLRRTWDSDFPRSLFVMLNPSTADAEIDDPTIRRCMGFARSWKYGGIEVINLFGLRTTDPGELAKAEDPIGPDNDRIAEAAIMRCDLVICAWGAHKFIGDRAHAIWDMISAQKPTVFCLGVTKQGFPRHPLYLKKDSSPMTYRP